MINEISSIYDDAMILSNLCVPGNGASKNIIDVAHATTTRRPLVAYFNTEWAYLT